MTGERTVGTRWERGTRRSRWRGYCVVGGAMLGYQAVAVANLVAAAMRGGNGAGVGMAIGETAPCGMVAGLLAGLVLGAISSWFLPEQAPPRDPDAG